MIRSRRRVASFVALCGTLMSAHALASDPVLLTQGSLFNTTQTSGTAKQDLILNAYNRGTSLEGSTQSPTPCGVYPAPYVDEPRGCQPIYYSGIVDLRTAGVNYSASDLALPTAGVPVCVGRVFSSVQGEPSKPHNSNGFQGWNWSQTALPEIVKSGSTVYLVSNAGAFWEYQQVGSSDLYRGVNGAAGVFERSASTSTDYELYTLREPTGRTTQFIGSDKGAPNWQLWKITNPDGKRLYVGDPSSSKDAQNVASGYTSGKVAFFIQEQGASADERKYAFTYSTFGGQTRLQKVEVLPKSGGSFSSTPVAKVEYDYYTTKTEIAANAPDPADDNDGLGDAGDLKSVTVTKPQSGGGDEVRTSYYRYYTNATWGSSVNETRGYAHCLKLVLEPEGYRRANAATTIATATTDSLKSYSAAFFFYANSGSDPRRVDSAFFNGECGCGGGPNGMTTFTWEKHTGVSWTSSYDTDWFSRTLVDQPDGTYQTRYFDEAGQPLSTVITPSVPTGTSITSMWGTKVVRDSNGRVSDIYSPAAVSSYNHTTGVLTSTQTPGLVTHYTRNSTSGSPYQGLVTVISFDDNSGGSSTELTEYSYTNRSSTLGSGTTADLTKPLVSQVKSAVSLSGGTYTWETVDFAYDFWSGSGTTDYYAVKSVKTTLPAVTTGNNGANAADYDYVFLRKDGRRAFTQSTDGVINAALYNTIGQPSKVIRDVNTSSTPGYDSAYEPSDFVYTGTMTTLASTGTALEYTTEYTYDDVGRPTLTKLPSGRYMGVYYSVLADGRLVSLTFPEVTVSGSPTHYIGPAAYAVTNLAGKPELSATLGTGDVVVASTPLSGWVDESSSDPLDTLSTTLRGSSRDKVRNLRTMLYDNAGVKVSESRMYFSISTSGTGGAWVGTNSNYDPTTYTYDDMGRPAKVVDPTGTIMRTMFDVLGRVSSQWIGTSDTSWPPVVGTSAAGNMTQTQAFEYDANGYRGNSYLTKATGYVAGDTYGFGSSTDRRETTNYYDVRGNLKVEVGAIKPYKVSDYDLQNRVTATAGYSSISSPSGSTATSTTTGRLTLAKTFYDERGQAYKMSRHNIDQSDGSDDDSLETLLWRDSVGRVIKEGGDRNNKTVYDRFGRTVRRFELARNNDSGYSDAATVTGDHVLTESQTLYDNIAKTGNVMMTAMISRHHAVDASGVTGELDTGYSTPEAYTLQAAVSGAEVKGRISINSFWYDSQDRQVGALPVGTNGNSSYNRAPSGSWASMPSRSSTVLLSETVYDDFGQVSLAKSARVVSSNPLKTRYLYDQANRKVAEIRNDTGSSSPTSTPIATADRDTDLYTRFTYDRGRIATMWVDFDGDNSVDSGDQVTTYTYGVVKSGGSVNSAVASNRLLLKVQYPNGASSTAADNTVTYTYNAQDQRLSKIDQSGNTHAYTYDNGGRQIIDAVTLAMGSTIDNAVLRIETDYVDRGMVKTVTQYNAASSGSVTDQVVHTYDGWGMLTDYQEDRDGAVTGTGSGGGSNDYAVHYEYSKASTTSAVSGTRRSGLRLDYTRLRYAAGTDAAYGANVHGWQYTYLSSSSPDTLLDEDAGFVTRVYKTNDDGGSSLQLVEYRYGGEGRVLSTSLVVPGIVNQFYAQSAGDPYSPYLDQWGRVISDQWMHGSGVVYKADPAYDESNNITSVPQYHEPLGQVFQSDGLNRLKRGQTGAVVSGAISGSLYAEDDWTAGGTSLTLGQTGNWTSYVHKQYQWLDVTVAGTFRDNNQYASRVETITGGSPMTLLTQYDKAGNLVDDDGPATGHTEAAYGYRYVYDAWNRLRKIYDGNGQSGALVEELRYNGLGHMIAEHADTDNDSDVDGSDGWRYNQYNDRWQLVATWLGSNAKPSEVYTFHNAGADGLGNSSYVDEFIARDRDKDLDGSIVREERLFYMQNWRHDVVVLARADSVMSGALIERIRYDAYGRPTSYNPADVGASGGVPGMDCSVGNNDDIVFLFSSGVHWYTDLGCAGGLGFPDGAKDNNDSAAYTSAEVDALNQYGGGGYGILSGVNLDNRIGYAGYRFDPVLAHGIGSTGKPVWHVRRRTLDSFSGKWFQMDPMGYVDGPDLYEYVASFPETRTDPTGECASCESRAGIIDNQPPVDPLLRPTEIPTPTITDPAIPKPSSPPTLDPGTDWGNRRTSRGNCFRYAMCLPARPGAPWPDHQLLPIGPSLPAGGRDGRTISCCPTCSQIIAAIKAKYGAVAPTELDGPPAPGPFKPVMATCKPGRRLIAVFAQNAGRCGVPCDQHYYRQEPDGMWTDKPGNYPVMPRCFNPEDENRWRLRIPYAVPGFQKRVPGYTDFCGYLCVK